MVEEIPAGKLETKIDEYQLEVYEDLKTLKSELRRKCLWDEQGRKKV